MLGFLGSLHWLLEMFCHFRLQYALSLLLIGSMLFVLGRRAAGSVCPAFCAVNLMLLVPLFRPPEVSAATPPATARILLQNVNRRFGDPARVLAFVRAENPDLIVVQEIDGVWAEALAVLDASYPHRLVEPRSGNFGIGLFSRWPLRDAEVIYLTAAPHPSLRVGVALPGTVLRVVATHPPPTIGPGLARQRAAQPRAARRRSTPGPDVGSDHRGLVVDLALPASANRAAAR